MGCQSSRPRPRRGPAGPPPRQRKRPPQRLAAWRCEAALRQRWGSLRRSFSTARRIRTGVPARSPTGSPPHAACRLGVRLGGEARCSGVPRPLLLRCLASYPVRFCISHTWGRALLFAAENAIIGCLNRPCPGSGRVDAESAGRCYLPTRKVPRRFHGRFLHIPWRRLYGTELGHPHAGWRVVHER